MIGALLDRVAPRVALADVCAVRDQTLSVTLRDGQPELHHAVEQWVDLRVVAEGRIGQATSRGEHPEALCRRALASAVFGPSQPLLLPAPAPLPAVITAMPTAAALSAESLLRVARLLEQGLRGDRRRVLTWAERSIGRVDVGNTRGVQAGYDVTMAGTGCTVVTDTAAGPLRLHLHAVSADAPSAAVLERLVSEVDARLAPPLLDSADATWRGPVTFAPRAVTALLEPLRQMCVADGGATRGALADRLGDRVFPERLTITDDPLVPGRPGSRPIDDEGVVAHARCPVEQGVVRAPLADLLGGARLGVPASGSARRVGQAPARAAWSNMVVGSGAEPSRDWIAFAEEGWLIRDLPIPSGRLVDGTFAVSTPWAYRIERGEVVGRAARVRLQGSIIELLGHLEKVGADGEWNGAAWAAPFRCTDIELRFD